MCLENIQDLDTLFKEWRKKHESEERGTRYTDTFPYKKDYITAVIVRQILFKVSPNIKNGEDVPHHFVFIAIPLCIYSDFRSDIVVYGFLGNFPT